MPEPGGIRELRRRQILDAARRIVADQGLDALTFAALEQELSFTRGVITWHFRNKDELLLVLLDEAIAEIDEVALVAVRSEATLADRARAVVREMVRGWLTGAGAVLVSHWGRLHANPEGSARVAALFARYRGYSAQLVRIGQQRGEFRSDADAEATGAMIVGVVLGIVIQRVFDPASPAVDAVVHEAGEAVVAHLRLTSPQRVP